MTALLPPRSTRADTSTDAQTDVGTVRDFVTLFLEVEAGLRPARHIRPLLSPDLQPLLGNCGRSGPMPSIRRIVTQRRDTVWESTVLLDDGDRVQALVVAMRRRPDGWRVEDVARPGQAHGTPPGTSPSPLLQTAWAPADPSPGPTWQVPAGWIAA